MSRHVADVQALLAREAPLDPSEVERLLAAIRQGPPASPAQRDALLPLLEELTARARTELKDVGKALRKLSSSRRALSAYGHLKSTRDAQHTNKLA